MPESLAQIFTTVAGVAAAITVIAAWLTNREQRYVRRAERASRQFDALVLNPIYKEIKPFVDRVSDLMTDGTKQRDLLWQGAPLHKEVLSQSQRLSEQFDAYFYTFKGAVDTALATWPDTAIRAQVTSLLQTLQDDIHSQIAQTSLGAQVALPARDWIQTSTSGVIRCLVSYDRSAHSGDPPAPFRWARK
jgi:hypothetical protein